MLYTKDEKKYVEMCQIFDKEFYEEDRDNAKLFKYLYLIFYMLACKENYFKKFEDYDGFAQLAATVVFVRFQRKLEKGERVKSVLNYAKSSKRFLRIMYQNQTFATIIGPEMGVDTSAITEEFKRSVQADYQFGLDEDISEILDGTPNAIRDAIDCLVYSKDRVMRQRVYISSLLTLLDNITLSNQQLQDLRLLTKAKKAKPATTEEIVGAFAKNREEKPLSWCLPDGQENVVRAVVNKARKDMSKSINDVTADYALPDDVFDSIMSSAYAEGCTAVEDESDYE